MIFAGKLDLGQKPEKTILYLILPLIFLAILFPAVYQADQVFVSEYHDTMALMFPDLFLAEHPFALWNNNWLTGYSEISSLNSDRFYPFSFPFVLASDSIFVVNLILFINLYIAFLAFYKLGSHLVKNQELLLIFSTGYMLSGVLLSRVLIGHIFFVYAMAWIPLVYYFFLEMARSSRISGFNIAALAICEAILLFTGGIYYFFFANAIVVIFFLWYFFSGHIPKPVLGGLICSAGLFLLLGAVKLLPALSGLPYIQRIDVINPLGDGGLLENNLASFIFGTPIDTVFGPYETMALIGIIPVIFAIIALIWGKRDITVPSFLALVFTLIWADGGRTLLSFIHLLPLVDSFRNAGRIFGAAMPILLLLSLYGVTILQERIREGGTLSVSADQKRAVLWGAGILVVIKILELPWAALPSPEAALAVALVAGFVILVFIEKATLRNLQVFFAASLIINIIVILRDFPIPNADILIKGVLIAAILFAALLWFNRNALGRNRIPELFFIGILIIGILFSVLGNISVLKPSDPGLDKSPAIEVIQKIQENPVVNPQVWVYETGWPIQHMDFTYWFLKNGIHPMRAFYSYVPLNTPPLALEMNSTDYYTADYLVDTAYLENGDQNLPESSFKIENMTVYKPAHVLPNAFVIREEGLVPAKVEKFSPDEITLSGQFRSGDLAFVKASFFPGWKINSRDASKVYNMPADQLDSDSSTIMFRYDPIEAKAGILLSVAGIILLVVLFFRRQMLEEFLNRPGSPQPVEKTRKRSKSRR